MNLYERQEALQSFRHHSQILVKHRGWWGGAKLQLAHLVINYDSLEPHEDRARIGRVHRIGSNILSLSTTSSLMIPLSTASWKS